MIFLTTKINLNTPSYTNSLTNTCFKFNRDVFGGREVTFINPKNISSKSIPAENASLFLTLFKVISMIALIPLGTIFRLLSLFNSDVRLALASDPKSPPPPLDDKKNQNSSNTPGSTPNINTLPPAKNAPISLPPPPLDDKKNQNSSNTSQPPQSTSNTSSSINPKILSNQMSLVCANSNATTNDLVPLLNQGCIPTTKNLLAVIKNGKYNLLSCFTNRQISVSDSKDVILIINAALGGNCLNLALELAKQHLQHIDPTDINENLFKSAKTVKCLPMCEWIIEQQPSLGLTVRSGFAYLALIQNTDSKIAALRSQLEPSSKTDHPLDRIQYLVDQLYVHIPYELLLIGLKEIDPASISFYVTYLNIVLSQPSPSVKQTSGINNPANWKKNELQFLELFKNLNDAKKSQIPQLFNQNVVLSKQAILYVEYLKLSSAQRTETGEQLLNLYQSVLNGLDFAKIKRPSEEGQAAFKQHLFEVLKTVV